MLLFTDGTFSNRRRCNNLGIQMFYISVMHTAVALIMVVYNDEKCQQVPACYTIADLAVQEIALSNQLEPLFAG